MLSVVRHRPLVLPEDALVLLLADQGHDPTDYDAATSVIMDREQEYQGILWQDEGSVSYHRQHGVTAPMVDIGTGAPDGAMDLVREFY